MEVVLMGASGMIGSGALLECLADPSVRRVRAIVRSPTGRQHDKLTEIVHGDLLDLSAIEDQLEGIDACLWCLGVSAGGLSEVEYRRITHDMTVACIDTLHRLNPDLAVCFVSGAGTSLQGRQMWARVKGEAERYVLDKGLRHATVFRPAAILPLKGVVSKTASYRVMYVSLGWLIGLLRPVLPGMITDTVTLGRALIRAARGEAPKATLENADINRLGA
jgi:uncharacterized protein YbjT (DUF2867 family)